jgi:DNA-binding NtrC family response regulator
LALIVLVEDRAEVRCIMQRALTEVGHRVYEAATCKEAMALLYLLDPPVRLTIIDLRLPDRMGSDLAADITREGLSRSVLLTSGDPTQIEELEATAARNCWSFLPKPFSPQQLVSAVQTILETSLVSARPSLSRKPPSSPG